MQWVCQSDPDFIASVADQARKVTRRTAQWFGLLAMMQRPQLSGRRTGLQGNS
jgi:hypothetical protein